MIADDMAAAFPLFIALVSLCLTIAGTRVVLGWLRRRQIMDIPNERSSHSQPTPRGGGLAVTPVAIFGLAGLGLSGSTPPGLPVILGSAAVLLVLSWIDDRRSLSARVRLAMHLMTVTAGITTFPSDALVFQGLLPLWADRLLAALGWVWFVNLYNFMDGIDGITGIETVSLGLGIAVIAVWAGHSAYIGPGLVLAAVAIGFLVWNWHPAKIFLGDSGSVPLGFILGWLLIRVAADGLWAPAIILPLYYLADATITITRRALRGERIWQAHRQHFYQRAVAAGASHSAVALSVLVCNLGLTAAAASTLVMAPTIGILTAGLLVATLLGNLTLRARQRKLAP